MNKIMKKILGYLILLNMFGAGIGGLFIMFENEKRKEDIIMSIHPQFKPDYLHAFLTGWLGTLVILGTVALLFAIFHLVMKHLISAK